MNRRGSYWLNLLKGLDYFLATLCGIPAGIYISAYVKFKRWHRIEKAINFIFRDDRHCTVAYFNNLDDLKQYYF